MKKLIFTALLVLVQFSSFAKVNSTGGSPVKYDEFPFQVGLYTFREQYFCSGVLVAPNWVLTAAHCMAAWSGANGIVVGLHDRRNYSGVEFFKSQKVVIHPEFNKKTLDNDLALIQLIGESYRKPIELNSDELIISENAPTIMAWATGWDSSRVASSVLQKVELPLVTNESCNSQFPYGRKVTSSMICAGYERGGKGPCQGDDGAPLLIKENENGPYKLVGIVSWGFACQGKSNYSVYSKINQQVDWIKEQIAQ